MKLVQEFTRLFKTNQNSEMNKLIAFLIVSTLISCNSPYREMKSIDEIDGVARTETMISLEESINDKKRLMHSVFREL